MAAIGAVSVFPTPSPSPSDTPAKSGTVVVQATLGGPDGHLLPGYRLSRQLCKKD